MPRRWIALILCLPLLLVGCAKSAPQTPEPVQAPTQEAAPKVRSGEEWEAEGKRLVGESKWIEAAHAYEEAAQLRPSADRWNEASYAYLMGKQYAEAIRTGRLALKEDPRHPYALYNTGMAYLAYDSPCEAINPLRVSASLQPTRWEPLQALGRAYLAAGRRQAATQSLQQAAAKGAPADSIDPFLQKAEPRIPPVAELTAYAKLLLKDGDVSFYRKEEFKSCNLPPEVNAWVVQAGQVAPLLPQKPAPHAVEAVTLPDGKRAYWLEGEEAGAYVSFAHIYYFLTLDGGAQRLFTFNPPFSDSANQALEPDELFGTGSPVIRDGLLISGYLDGASGTKFHSSSWRLDLANRRAVKVDDSTSLTGMFVSMDASSVTIKPAEGTRKYQPWTEQRGANLTVTKDGVPVSPDLLKPGQEVTLILRDRKVVEIHL